jgi:hypothetical protein
MCLAAHRYFGLDRYDFSHGNPMSKPRCDNFRIAVRPSSDRNCAGSCEIILPSQTTTPALDHVDATFRVPGATGRLCGAELRRYRKNSPICRRHLPISRWKLCCDAKKNPGAGPGRFGLWLLNHDCRSRMRSTRARVQRCEPPSPENRSTIQRSGDSPCSRTIATSAPSSRM